MIVFHFVCLHGLFHEKYILVILIPATIEITQLYVILYGCGEYFTRSTYSSFNPSTHKNYMIVCHFLCLRALFHEKIILVI